MTNKTTEGKKDYLFNENMTDKNKTFEELKKCIATALANMRIKYPDEGFITGELETAQEIIIYLINK